MPGLNVEFSRVKYYSNNEMAYMLFRAVHVSQYECSCRKITMFLIIVTKANVPPGS